MLELIFIRHGQTDWNLNRCVMGRQPVPLNATGMRQAEWAAAYLKDAKIGAVISSPVVRAFETARIVAAPQGVEAIADDAFTEIDYGEWVNCGFEELPRRWPAEWATYRREFAESSFPGGESARAAAGRIEAAVRRVLAMDGIERAAIVSHADVIKTAMVAALRLPLETVGRFAVDNGAVILVRLCDESGPRVIFGNAVTGFGKDIRISGPASTDGPADGGGR